MFSVNYVIYGNAFNDSIISDCWELEMQKNADNV